jgi:hypothetical protein
MTEEEAAKNAEASKGAVSPARSDSPDSSSTSKPEMATVADLFSFAETIRCKLLIAGGLALSMVSGVVFPGSYDLVDLCV